MKICASCNHSNLEGVFFCEECGQPLYGGLNVIATKQIASRLLGNAPAAVPIVREAMAPLAANQSIVLQIQGVREPVVLRPQAEMLLGRADPALRVDLAVDFTPFGGVENGVSRAHAALRRADNRLTLVDLGSVNGTHLNGQRLTPNQPSPLRDGDEIQLGRLVLRVFFR